MCCKPEVAVAEACTTPVAPFDESPIAYFYRCLEGLVGLDLKRYRQKLLRPCYWVPDLAWLIGRLSMI